MGYLHIANSYRPEGQHIFLFRECYALEKIDGTSAHVSWKGGELSFFSGGATHSTFVALFDQAALRAAFEAMGHEEVVVFGEAYGGKVQGMSERYGKALKFIAFDVKVGDLWLNVPNAQQVAERVGFEFVHYVKIPTDLVAVDAERDATSEQARRNGIEGFQRREGVVLRPLQEFKMNGGDRVITKHKRAEERETRTERRVDDPAKLQVLQEAEAIAHEWVTPMRLEHVLNKLLVAHPDGYDISHTPEVIKLMTDDVLREGAGEIVDSKDARRAIGAAAVKLFKQRVTTVRA